MNLAMNAGAFAARQDVTPLNRYIGGEIVESGDQAVLEFIDEVVAASPEDGWTLRADGVDIPVLGASLDGTTVTLSLGGTVYSGSTVTLSYDKWVGSVERLASFKNKAVENHSVIPRPGASRLAGQDGSPLVDQAGNRIIAQAKIQ